MRPISSLEMSAIDRNSRYLGIEPIVLMENAGRQVAWEVSKRREPTSVAVLSGPGNNGGDGYVVARHLTNMGWKVSVVHLERPSTEEATRNLDILRRMSRISLRSISDSGEVKDPGFARWLGKHEIVIDALLGTGVRGAPREPIASIIRATGDTKTYRVAVDVPSGVNADTGEWKGEVFKADLTVTFHRAKSGHAKAGEVVGELVVADIGIPQEAETLAGPGDLLFIRDRREEGSHKGDNGVLLVVGGSKDYQGAPAIAGIAAMRTGIDLTYVAVPDAIKEIVAKHSPSLITRSYQGDHLNPDALDALQGLVDKANAICLGPGLGNEDETLEAVAELVKSMAGKPVVLDADGLKAFAGGVERLEENMVITPHGGEFKVLTGEDLPTEEGERAALVATWASRSRCVWTVKGAHDVIAHGSELRANQTGTACMTVGGTGDCLTGVIGGLMARGNDPFRSAVAGCFILGKAGEIASEKRGCHLLPTDVAEEIPTVFARYGPK